MDIHQLIGFLGRHWPLAAAFLFTLILVFVEEARSGGAGGKRMTPQQLTYSMNHEKALVVDIRDGKAYRDGHIAGCKNIPESEFDAHLSQLGDKQRLIVIVSGNQLQKAQVVARKLYKSGYKKVHQLGGGINAWKNASLPLVKGK